MAETVGGRDAPGEEALLRGDGCVQLHSPPDLRRARPHALVSRGFVPGDDGVHHQPGVEHAVLHPGAVAARIGNLQSDQLRFRQILRRRVRLIAHKVVIKHAGALVKETVPDEIPRILHVYSTSQSK